MREPHQLSDAEFRQYRSLMAQINDPTIGTGPTKLAQEAVDKLLWKDSDGRLMTLEQRVARIEATLGIEQPPCVAPNPAPVTYEQPAATAPTVSFDPATVAPNPSDTVNAHQIGHSSGPSATVPNMVGSLSKPPVETAQPIGTRVEDIPPGTPHREAQAAVQQEMGLRDNVTAKIEQPTAGFTLAQNQQGEWVVINPNPAGPNYGPFPDQATADAARARIAQLETMTQAAAPQPEATQPAPAATTPVESEDGRGRPKNRFTVDGKRGNWYCVDNTGQIPAEKFPSYKLKKDATNSARGLNGHPDPDGLFANAPVQRPEVLTEAAADPAQATPPTMNPRDYQPVPQPVSEINEYAPIPNWDPDAIVPGQQAGDAFKAAAENQAAAQAPQGVIPMEADPKTGHTNAPVAGGGVITPGGAAGQTPETTVIHKPTMADAGEHLMANPDGSIQSVDPGVALDPMGIGNM